MGVLNTNVIDIERINNLLQDKKPLIIDVSRLAKSAKQELEKLIEGVLKKYNKMYLKDAIFSGLLEIAFNAIKANYQFILIRDEIARYLVMKEKVSNPSEQLKSILSDHNLYEQYLEKIDDRKIKDKLRRILKREEEITKIVETAIKEKRNLTMQEKRKIKENYQMIRRAKKMGITVKIWINVINDTLIIDVLNDVPISKKGLKRINSKTKLFLEYYKAGKEQNFYIENIDESESAGFGAAMIYASLLRLDLNPEEHFTIWGVKNKTIATLKFPLK